MQWKPFKSEPFSNPKRRRLPEEKIEGYLSITMD
jgi:hypothetical protein